jgi:hypothetical protein
MAVNFLFGSSERYRDTLTYLRAFDAKIQRWPNFPLNGLSSWFVALGDSFPAATHLYRSSATHHAS